MIKKQICDEFHFPDGRTVASYFLKSLIKMPDLIFNADPIRLIPGVIKNIRPTQTVEGMRYFLPFFIFVFKSKIGQGATTSQKQIPVLSRDHSRKELRRFEGNEEC